MIWLFKKVFYLVLFTALAIFIANYKIDGKPVKDYVLEVYHSPLVQEGIRLGTNQVKAYLHKDVGEPGAAPSTPAVGDELTEADRRELDSVLKKEAGR